ncbi:hypothetical protein [Microbacterium sp. A84]|uniref:hypothetical protein n=1 Tax=Microbacterium sp. A84 TaxID=3450715 RepID=UPI003F41CE9D
MRLSLGEFFTTGTALLTRGGIHLIAHAPDGTRGWVKIIALRDGAVPAGHGHRLLSHLRVVNEQHTHDIDPSEIRPGMHIRMSGHGAWVTTSEVLAVHTGTLVSEPGEGELRAGRWILMFSHAAFATSGGNAHRLLADGEHGPRLTPAALRILVRRMARRHGAALGLRMDAS